MTDFEQLQRRVTEAFQRLESAAKMQSAGGESPDGHVRELVQANQSLSAEVDSLKRRRNSDAAELDLLITRLKPLLEVPKNA